LNRCFQERTLSGYSLNCWVAELLKIQQKISAIKGTTLKVSCWIFNFKISAIFQIVKLPGRVYQKLCLKLRKMPRISQKTKLLELLTGSILSDIVYLHILYDYNSFMFSSDQSYSLTFSREQRQLWFSAIQQHFQQPRGCWIAEISESWLCMEQHINSWPKFNNSAFQQYREYPVCSVEWKPSLFQNM